KASISFSDFPMTTAATQSWLALLATGVMVIPASLIALPAKAAPCTNNLLISTIVAAGPAGYSCELGILQYTFFEDINELGIKANGQPNTLASISFTNSTYAQEITFQDLDVKNIVYFAYQISALAETNETIDSVRQTLVQDPASPPPDPGTTDLTPDPSLPFWPYGSPITLTASYEPSSTAVTLKQLNHTIEKTPAPLPLAGAGFAFGFSRKLRRRILRASPSRHHAG
ncbi:MAG: hypothetical protein ACK6BC_13955, partial [Cyanobacteriota bacterium]